MGKKESGMIVVRFVFQAKFGKAEEVVNGFKEGAETMRRIAGQNAKFGC